MTQPAPKVLEAAAIAGSDPVPPPRPAEVASGAVAPPPGGQSGTALFQALMEAGVDPLTAHVAAREVENAAGHNVVVQLGAQIEARFTQLEAKFDSRIAELDAKFDARINQLEAKFDARISQVEARLDAKIEAVAESVSRLEDKVEALTTETRKDVDTVRTDLAKVTTDVAVLKKEVRIGWAAGSVAVPTLTIILMELFGR